MSNSGFGKKASKRWSMRSCSATRRAAYSPARLHRNSRSPPAARSLITQAGAQLVPRPGRLPLGFAALCVGGCRGPQAFTVAFLSWRFVLAAHRCLLRLALYLWWCGSQLEPDLREFCRREGDGDTTVYAEFRAAIDQVDGPAYLSDPDEPRPICAYAIREMPPLPELLKWPKRAEINARWCRYRAATSQRNHDR